MNNWFFIALMAPLLWSAVNCMDKYLLRRFPDGRGVGAVMIFSTCFSIVVLPVIYFFFGRQVFDFPGNDISLLFIAGICSALAFMFYLKAIDIDDMIVVVLLLQLAPLFGYILSYFLLDESLSGKELMASAVILAGIFISSFEVNPGKTALFKWKVILLATVSSLLFALHDTLFKMVAVHKGFWTATFWQYSGLALTGGLVFALIPSYRSQFNDMLALKQFGLIRMNVLAETTYILGNLAANFATLLAPVALVLVVSSYQPLFVFALSILLTVFLPHIIREQISKRDIIQKAISIVITLVGSYMLFTSKQT